MSNTSPDCEDLEPRARKILIVEDSPRLRERLSSILQDTAYEVYVAVDRSEAMELFHLQCPELLVLDLSMSPIDSYEVCRRLRMVSGVRIVIIGGGLGPNEEERATAFRAGADAFVTKFCDANELLLAVDSLLAERRS